MALELLKDNLKPGARFLDVGSGSGVMLAYAAHMVGKQGQVYGVEHIGKLAEQSLRNLSRAQLPSELREIIHVKTGDGRLGWAEHAPFDAIHVGAAAPQLPQPLIDQLAVGGRLLIPVVVRSSQEMMLIHRISEKEVTEKSICGVQYVPLCDAPAQRDL